MMATSPSFRRARYRGELRAVILDAARKLFIADGFEAFSMRKLAQQVGYSPASLYQHFSSKDELFQCLVQESFGKLAETIRSAAEAQGKDAQKADPVELLRSGLRAYIRFGLEHPHEYRFVFLMPASQKPSETGLAAFRSLRHKVETCILTGRFRPVDPDMAAQVLWATVHGLISLLITRPSFPWVEKDMLIGQLVDNALRGMVAPEA